MNDLLKNPIALFVAGILTLWLAFKVMKVFLSFFWIIVVIFVIMFAFNDRFRDSIRLFFAGIFRN
jgi:predicted metal-binding membrane protein